jgi:predicted TIM-barrel fold metal-dependent hydrolase
VSLSARDIRARLDHPVIDADGHCIEFVPLVRDLMVEDAGESVARRFDAVLAGSAAVRPVDDVTRRAVGYSRTGWWALPAVNTLDRATAMLPKLLHDRLDDIGIDLAFLYPTLGLMPMALDDDEMRCALARACNRYYTECYGPYRDRLRPVAIIPTYTPDEAIAELEFAHGVLGMRTFLFGGLVLRPTPGAEGLRAARWVDGLGLDSVHDYSPLWQRCVELGVTPTFHSTGIGFGSRTSPRNYVANHIGNFAAGNEAIARSLLFGGMATQFPQLRAAFLEGGVSWAAQLYADLCSHFAKRNRDALGHYDARQLDRAALSRLVHDHGEPAVVARADRLSEGLSFLSDPDEPHENLDEWASSGVASTGDLARVFADQWFFGCEADDPMNALAFDRHAHPGGISLRAMFASDIGHWDVPDFLGVLPEAWELVEDGRVDEAQFRAFTCDNVIALLGPQAFAGTVVEEYAHQGDKSPGAATETGG